MKLFETGGLLSKKNLAAWMSLLLLFHLPFFFELYLLLSYGPQWWGAYVAALVLMMFLGALVSSRLLHHQLNLARRAYDRDVLHRLMGCYLLPLALLSPGLVSFVLGLTLAIPRVTTQAGRLLARLLAVAPQQWYNSVLLVHSREQEAHGEAVAKKAPKNTSDAVLTTAARKDGP